MFDVIIIGGGHAGAEAARVCARGGARVALVTMLRYNLECEGFAVQTMGLRRSGLVAKDIDALLAENTITRMTLTLMPVPTFVGQAVRYPNRG